MKILIIEPTQVNYLDDRGGQHADAGDFCDPPKDVARKLTEVGRAVYVNKADDPTKEGIYTATKEMIAAAESMAKVKARAAKAKPAGEQTAGGEGNPTDAQ